MYLTLSQLQAPPTLNFPFALGPLREALRVINVVLDCSECPKTSSTGMMNTALVNTLMQAAAGRFRDAIDSIDHEADSAASEGKKKRFDLGVADQATMHLHTGMPDCPGRFAVELEPDEWRSMSKRVVKVEVVGNSETQENSLLGLVEKLEKRQQRWHADPEKTEEALRLMGINRCAEMAVKGDYYCLRFTGMVKDMIDMMTW
ncbi:hypothetical protein LTS18_007400 [Coniosporium uncinatum]|uniref:Uncharacterized protein n=1 Tax=Coniosporium uncinatum TaxID=93489 RepID=A0ACC3DPM7_9PEZI|nr:hypothetical protein LTS18_007400 [Coniosporium uncinatum]